MASKYITLEQGMILSSACEKMNAFFFGGKKAEKAIKLPAKVSLVRTYTKFKITVFGQINF